MPGLDVVLVEADADVRRLDLHQFRERILEPAADRDGAADRGLVAGELVARVGAGGVDARPGLVDDAVGDVGGLERTGEQLDDERLRVATGGAVADGDHVHRVLLDEFHDPAAGGLALFLLADDLEHRVLLGNAALVDHHRLAAALESRVDRQHASAGDGGLEEEVAQVPGEDRHGVRLAVFGDLAADLALEPRENETRDRIPRAAAQEFGVGVGGIHEDRLGGGLELLDRPVDLHLEQPGPFATVDRQRPVGRDALQQLGVVEVVAVVLGILGERLALGLHPLAGEMPLLPEDHAQRLAHVGALGEHVGDDVPHAEEGVGHRGDLGIGVDEVGRPRPQIGGRRLGGEDLARQRLEAPLPGDLGQRQLARLEGKVEVLELLGALGGLDPLLEILRQPALPLDRAQDRLLAVGDLPGPADGVRDPPDVDLVEAAGLVATVARDEGDGVPLVEKANDRIHALRGKAEATGDRPEIDERDGWHALRGSASLGDRTPLDSPCAPLRVGMPTTWRGSLVT